MALSRTTQRALKKQISKCRQQTQDIGTSRASRRVQTRLVSATQIDAAAAAATSSSPAAIARSAATLCDDEAVDVDVGWDPFVGGGDFNAGVDQPNSTDAGEQPSWRYTFCRMSIYDEWSTCTLPLRSPTSTLSTIGRKTCRQSSLLAAALLRTHGLLFASTLMVEPLVRIFFDLGSRSLPNHTV